MSCFSGKVIEMTEGLQYEDILKPQVGWESLPFIILFFMILAKIQTKPGLSEIVPLSFI